MSNSGKASASADIKGANAGVKDRKIMRSVIFGRKIFWEVDSQNEECVYLLRRTN